MENDVKMSTGTLTTEVTKLSESISKPLERLFQVGGLALVFVFVGFLSMLVGYLNKTDLSGWFFGVGASIVFACLCLFLFSQFYGPIKAGQLLRENKELIDSVQDMAIKLTDSLSDIQALMFKHSEYVGKILEVASPVLSQIPLLSEVDFLQTQNVNSLIVNTTDKSRKVIDDVREALITCKVGHLKEYSEDLAKIRLSLKEALKKQEEVKNKIVDYKEMFDSLRQCLLEYTEAINSTNTQALSYVTQVDSIMGIAGRLPFVSNKLDQIGFGRAETFSKDLREVLTKSQEANDNLRTALTDGNVENLKSCLQGLKEINSLFLRMKQLKG